MKPDQAYFWYSGNVLGLIGNSQTFASSSEDVSNQALSRLNTRRTVAALITKIMVLRGGNIRPSPEQHIIAYPLRPSCIRMSACLQHDSFNTTSKDSIRVIEAGGVS